MIKLEFKKGYTEIFRKNGLNAFEDFFNHPGQRLINKNKKREVIAFNIDSGSQNGEFYMKRFFKPYFKDKLFSLLNFGKFCSLSGCEWQNADALLSLGIKTAVPVCYGEDSFHGFENRSFIITEKIPGRCFTEILADNWHQMDQQKKEMIMISIAKLARRMHDARICFPDLYVWHIFIPEDFNGNDEDLTIIDLHRMRINVKSISKQMKNLGAFEFSMSPKYFDERLKNVFYDAYFTYYPIEKKHDCISKIKQRSEVLLNRRSRHRY